MANSYNNIKAIVATHLTLSSYDMFEVYGQCHSIADFFKDNARKFIFIRHPLNGGYNSKADIFIQDRDCPRMGTVPILKTKRSGVIRYILDFISTVNLVRNTGEKWDIFIGVNSLNTLAGIVLKKLGYVKYVIFYTSDYVPVRFSNKALNFIYHLCDRNALRYSDFVWNISNRQWIIRKSQGIPDKKNIYVPHGAYLSKIKQYPVTDINRYSMVIAANLTSAFNFQLIIDAFKEIVSRVNNAELIIIGTGVKENEIRMMIEENQLKNSIHMKGFIKHDNLLDFLPKCGIGLAIYTSINSWTEFSDSFKVKEYLACGCPVIITSNATAAVEEAQKSNAIIVINLNKQELVNAALKLLTNDELYWKYRKNAIEFMKNLDWYDLYNERLKFLLDQNGTI